MKYIIQNLFPVSSAIEQANTAAEAGHLSGAVPVMSVLESFTQTLRDIK